MGKALAVVKTIDDLVSEIAGHVYDLHAAQKRCNKLRLSAGLKLLELRGLVEAGGDNWWDWWEANKGRLMLNGRKDCERLMRIASADDPEAALADERAKDRDRKRIARGADKAMSAPKPELELEEELPNAEDEGDSLQVIRRRAWLNMALRAADMADSFLNEDSDHRAIASADPAEIDAEIIDAVWKAATLWSEVYKTLKREPVGAQRPCRKCHGTGTITGKYTGTMFDCDCARK